MTRTRTMRNLFADFRPLTFDLWLSTPPPASHPSQSPTLPPPRPRATRSTVPDLVRSRSPYPTGPTPPPQRSAEADWHRAENSGRATSSVECRGRPGSAASRTASWREISRIEATEKYLKCTRTEGNQRREQGTQRTPRRRETPVVIAFLFSEISAFSAVNPFLWQFGFSAKFSKNTPCQPGAVCCMNTSVRRLKRLSSATQISVPHPFVARTLGVRGVCLPARAGLVAVPNGSSVVIAL